MPTSSKLPEIRLKPKREESVLFGHPWVFSGAIAEGECAPGDLVRLLDSRGNFLAVATANLQQSLALRIIDRRDVAIDTAWFAEKFQALAAYRKQFLPPDTNAYRLCFGESDRIPGLVVDLFGEVAAIQVNTKGMERLLPHIEAALQRPTIIVATSRSGVMEKVQVTETHRTVWAKELGLDICLGGQKTGWFCDQRDNRALIANAARGCKNALNLFSFTAGFSLHLLRAGVPYVVNVDCDEKALALSEEMKERNHLPGVMKNICTDIWKYRPEEKFDLVICDPPAFAKSAHDKPNALKGYKDIFKQAIHMTAPGGILACFSCSQTIAQEDLEWVCRQILRETGRVFQTVAHMSQGFDHPIPVFFPESRYLKGLLMKEV